VLRGLNHITIAVSDLERSLNFYANLLGMTPHIRWDKGAYSYRNLRLAGFSLCFVGPILLFYSFEIIIKKWQNGVWYVYNEFVSKSLLIVAIATVSYFYNITVINTISPSIERWIEHMVVFAWPYVPLFIPFLNIIYAILYWNHSPEEKKLIIKGQNQDDILEIIESQFVYAESDQNYVTIFYKNENQIDKRLMRSSLQHIEDQIDFAVRVHRSFLINPAYLKKVSGNKRKRTAILKDVDSIIPVSVNFVNDPILDGSN
jgi:hypothetical protein